MAPHGNIDWLQISMNHLMKAAFIQGKVSQQFYLSSQCFQYVWFFWSALIRIASPFWLPMTVARSGHRAWSQGQSKGADRRGRIEGAGRRGGQKGREEGAGRRGDRQVGQKSLYIMVGKDLTRKKYPRIAESRFGYLMQWCWWFWVYWSNAMSEKYDKEGHWRKSTKKLPCKNSLLNIQSEISEQIKFLQC